MHTYPALDSNNNLVFIKTVPAFSEEAHIWAALTSSPLCDDPLNHTIPVLDVLYFCPDFASVGSSNADGDARLFVVMRALRALQVQVSKFNDKLSGIESIKDVATLAFQLVEVRIFLSVFIRSYIFLQGLAFMHSQGVVHNVSFPAYVSLHSSYFGCYDGSLATGSRYIQCGLGRLAKIGAALLLHRLPILASISPPFPRRNACARRHRSYSSLVQQIGSHRAIHK